MQIPLRYVLALAVITVHLGVVAIGRPAYSEGENNLSSSADHEQTAVVQLSDDDYVVRNKAAEEVKADLSRSLLTLASVRSAEGQATVLSLLTYNDGLNHWLEGVLTLPQEQQIAELELATHPGARDILSGIYGRGSEIRVKAIHEIQKFGTLDWDRTLSQAIADDDREVSLAAMEVAWGRKPGPLVVDALWKKAILFQPAQPAPLLTHLTFFSRHVADAAITPKLNAPMTDDDIATDVLIHTNATCVENNVVMFLHHFAAKLKDVNLHATDPVYLGEANAALYNTFILAQRLKLRAAVPAIYLMATHPRVRLSIEFQDGGKIYQTSNRTAAAAIFLIMTDQPHDAFSWQDGGSGRSRWFFTDEHEEEKAIEGIKGWWKDHGKEYAGM